MVQVESMACGTPVISTDLPTGVPWVNADSVSGFVVAPGSAGAIVEAVGRMRDPGTWERLSKGARNRAVTMFDGPALLGKVVDQYSSVLAERGDGNGS
jgi:rhamnosyl/mannosyltransferase